MENNNPQVRNLKFKAPYLSRIAMGEVGIDDVKNDIDVSRSVLRRDMELIHGRTGPEIKRLREELVAKNERIANFELDLVARSTDFDLRARLYQQVAIDPDNAMPQLADAEIPKELYEEEMPKFYADVGTHIRGLNSLIAEKEARELELLSLLGELQARCMAAVSSVFVDNLAFRVGEQGELDV